MPMQKLKLKRKPLRIAKFVCSDYQLRALEALRPPETITVSDWAERYRVLDSLTSAEPGPWSNRRTPYLRGIMDEFNSYETEEIIFVKPTQVGGTECMNNMLGWVIMQDPSPVEIVYPTQELAETVSAKRLQPMIKASDPLKRKYDDTSKVLELGFSDMFVKIVGSNSPVGVASFAMKYLFIDEIDKFPGASKTEADPVSLAEERTKTFRGRKIFKTSTPTIRTGHIWRAKESADLEKHFFVPCPHCGEMIELNFANLRWPGKSRDLTEAYGAETVKEQLQALGASDADDGEDLSDADRAEYAYYVCQECGAVITNQQRLRMLQSGEWLPVRRETRFVRKVCFWINTLYSPFVSFSEIARNFLKSRDDPEKLQNFTNSWLAEPWEDTKLKTSAELVLDRQTDLPEFIVPEWAKMLTGGVDVQKDCLYWTIRAYGDYVTSQNVCHGQAMSWEELADVMNSTYYMQDGTPMVVCLALIDSGFNSDDVYDFCASNSEWAVPSKGSSTEMLGHYKLSTVNRADSRADGMTLVVIDSGKYKDMIASRMHRQNGKGSWMVYQGCDFVYCQQVTAEQKVSEKKGGVLKQVWKPKASHADNHYLDCEVYSLAAADINGVRMLHIQGQQVTPQKSQANPEAGATAEDRWIDSNESWL